MNAATEDEIDDEIHSRYQIGIQLGKGAYGVVWKAVDKLRPNRIVAVKKVCDAFRSCEDAVRTFREVEILLRLNEFPHPNIVRLVNVVPARNDADLYLIFDYVPNSLVSIIAFPILNSTQRRYIGYQIVRAIHFLHSADVLHRDLKPSNVLIDKHCNVKLCDFGLARVVTDLRARSPPKQMQPLSPPLHSASDSLSRSAAPFTTTKRSLTSTRPLKSPPRASKEAIINEDEEEETCMTDYIATRWYRSPELLLSSRSYGKPADIWALGCILLELETMQPALPGNDNEHQMLLTLELTGLPSSAVVRRMSRTSSQIPNTHREGNNEGNEELEHEGQRNRNILPAELQDLPPIAQAIEQMRRDVVPKTLAQRLSIVPLPSLALRKSPPTSPTSSSSSSTFSASTSLQTPQKGRRGTSSSQSPSNSRGGTSTSAFPSSLSSPMPILTSSTYSAFPGFVPAPGVVESCRAAGLDPTSPKALLFDLLTKVLVFDSNRRIGATEMLLHPYFAPFVRPECEPTCSLPMQLRVSDSWPIRPQAFSAYLAQSRENEDKKEKEEKGAKMPFVGRVQKIIFDPGFYRNQLYYMISELKARQLPSVLHIRTAKITVKTRQFGILETSAMQLLSTAGITIEDLDAWDGNKHGLTPLLSLEEMEKAEVSRKQQLSWAIRLARSQVPISPTESRGKQEKEKPTGIDKLSPPFGKDEEDKERNMTEELERKIGHQFDDVTWDKMMVLRAIERFAHTNQHIFYGEFVDTLIMLYLQTLSNVFLTCYEKYLQYDQQSQHDQHDGINKVYHDAMHDHDNDHVHDDLQSRNSDVSVTR